MTTSSFQPVDPAFFAAFVNATASLAKELRFRVGPAGVECKAWDPAKIAFTEWRIGAEYFRALPEGPLMVVDVDGPSLVRALKGVEKHDELVLAVSEGVIRVAIRRENARFARTVPRGEFDVSERAIKLPPAALTATIASKSFAAAVKEVASVAERVEIIAGVDPDKSFLAFRGEDDTRHSAHVEIDPVHPGEIVSGAGVGKFSAEYLVRLSELSSVFAMVKLGWGGGKPLEIVYEFPGVWARYLVAPVVQND